MSSPGANGKMGVPRTGNTHTKWRQAQTFRALCRAPLQKTDLSDIYYGKETRWQELSWPLENDQYAQAVCLCSVQECSQDIQFGMPALGMGTSQPEQCGARLCSAEPSLSAHTGGTCSLCPAGAQWGQTPAEELGKHKGLSTTTLWVQQLHRTGLLNPAQHSCHWAHLVTAVTAV